MNGFKDHFSRQSDLYAKYRPDYPASLYSFLAGLCKEKKLVWDCGTGNGQAAIGLSEHFEMVVATDPSAAQIRNAVPLPNINYRLERSESSSLPAGSADLITVANALHWFDLNRYYEEVKRVLKQDGIFAAWCYVLPDIDEKVDPVLQHFHNYTIGNFWLPENKLVQNEYRDLPFPFSEMPSPVFYSEKDFDLADLLAYLNTWSAVQRFIQHNDFNPTDELRQDLVRVWPNTDEKKKIRWKLFLKVGQNKS